MSLLRESRLMFLAAGVFGGAVLMVLFTRVGHLSDRTYMVAVLLLLSASFMFGWYGRAVPFLTAMLAVSGARLITLGRLTEAHHLLFPLHVGMAAGLCARAFYLRSRSMEPPPRSKADPLIATVVWSTIGLVFVLVLRAFIRSYGWSSLWGAPIQDREIAPGVSSNYAFYLALLPAVHVLGPLLVAWAYEERRAAAQGDHAGMNEATSFGSAECARQIWLGLALGAGLNFAVMGLQRAGADVLFLGTGRSQEAGRLPGLFTDSGMSSIFIPLLCYALFVVSGIYNGNISHRTGATIGKGTNANASRKTRALTFTSAILLCLLGLVLSLSQGRAVYLSMLGLATYLWITSAGRQRWLAAAAAMGVAVALVGLVAFLVGSSMALPEGLRRMKVTTVDAIARWKKGDVVGAVLAVDPPRAELSRAGLQIIRERPGLGSGLNSFMVETARLRREQPELPKDNPANVPLGILSDLGIAGFLLFVCFGAALFVPSSWPGASPAAGPSLVKNTWALPVALLPSVLIGYHIVAAEFVAVLALPLLLSWDRPSFQVVVRRRRLFAAALAAGAAAYGTATLLYGGGFNL